MTALGGGLGIVLLTALLAGAGVTGVEASPVTRRVLANGMTVLVRESPVTVVAVSLQLRAGSRFETLETAGVTNFLHRVMARATVRRTAGQLAEAAEDIGGRVDASGEVEYAEVRGEALGRHWVPLLELVAETALQPSLPVEEIERERRLILSQIQTREDAPFQTALDTFLRELYGRHPYAVPSVGVPASLERMTRPVLLAHYREIYRPDRLVLAISGPVVPDPVLRVVERLFGRMPAQAAGAQVPVPEPTAGEARRVVERPARQAQVLVGFLGPRLSDRDYPALKVLGAVLGGGMAGRLFTELRERRGLAYSLGALSPYRTDRGFLLTYLGTAPANEEAAETGILRELEKVRAEGVTPPEVARAKAYLLGALDLDRRTNARQAWYLAFFEVVGAGWDYPERYARALQAVTAEEVTDVARRYLVRPTTVVLRPTAR